MEEIKTLEQLLQDHAILYHQLQNCIDLRKSALLLELQRQEQESEYNDFYVRYHG
jgi:hypothetical protein